MKRYIKPLTLLEESSSPRKEEVVCGCSKGKARSSSKCDSVAEVVWITKGGFADKKKGEENEVSQVSCLTPKGKNKNREGRRKLTV